MNRMYFDNLDLSILTALSSNARTPYLEIARDNGVSGAAVHQRVQRLMANKVINGSHCCIEPTAVGFTVVAYLGINALPGTDVEKLAAELSKIDEITECHIVSGRFDIIAKLYARDNHDMLTIIRERTRQLQIASTETMVSFREAFTRPIPISND
jgi:transcriptional regulator, asnC family